MGWAMGWYKKRPHILFYHFWKKNKMQGLRIPRVATVATRGMAQVRAGEVKRRPCLLLRRRCGRRDWSWQIPFN